MKNYWKLVKIGDIGEVVGGGTPSTKCSDYYGGDIPWITPKDLSNFRNRYISRGERMISKLGLENSSARMLPPFSVLFTSRAPIGYIAIAKNELCTNQGFKSIIPDPKKCNALFLYYLLKYKKNDIELIANGSTFQEVSGTALKNFEVSIPPLDEQRKIAGILSALDDKIELNNKINRNLEAQAQAIFKSWFIDFEPFKNGKFIDSELGKIPEGWKVESIYSISEVIYGAPFSSNLFNNKQLGTPIIRIRDLPNEASNTYTTESHPKGYLIKQGDIVVGMDGEFKAYLWGGDNAWLNQRICVFKSKLNVSTAFVMFSIVPLLNEVESSELATTVIHLGKNDIDRFKIILPKLNILKEFNRISIPIFDTIIKNKKESQRLVQLRESLLPKLISGEIDVSGVVV